MRLGPSHAMLLAARPHQLVGMILSRQAAATAEQPLMAQPPSQQQQQPGALPVHPAQRISPRKTSRVLTPDAILRQQRKPNAPVAAPSPPPQSLDVFNALMGAQTFDDTEQTQLLDMSDFTYPDVGNDMSNSFFDLPSTL